MRIFLLVALVGCGTTDIDAPDDCAVDELHIIHGTTDERLTLGNHAFINAFGGNALGTLDLSTMTGDDVVHIEWTKLAARGDTVDARGRVTLPGGLDVGNCETGGLVSRFHVEENVWRFQLDDLRMAPYCGGAVVAESLGGCYRSE